MTQNGMLILLVGGTMNTTSSFFRRALAKAELQFPLRLVVDGEQGPCNISAEKDNIATVPRIPLPDVIFLDSKIAVPGRDGGFGIHQEPTGAEGY